MTTAAPAVAQCEAFKVISPLPETGDFMGRAVALDGRVLLVGSPGDGTPSIYSPGAVHSFLWDGNIWSHEQTLSGEVTGEGFGSSIAMDGDTAVIGGVHPDGGGTGVRVYERTATGWALTDVLTPPVGAQAPIIGNAVAISGDTIVASGAAYSYYNSIVYREAFVYARTATGWVSEATLVAEDEGSYYGIADFGMDVAIDGDTIAVASPTDIFSQLEPSVYIFERLAGQWVQQARLREPTLGAFVVAIDGDTVVGCGGYPPEADAHVFVDNGLGWSLETVLPFDATCAAVEDDTIALGGLGQYSDPSIRLFEHVSGKWHARGPFKARDALPGEHFSTWGLALDGSNLVAGAWRDNAGPILDTGSAFVFGLDVAQSFCTTSVNTTGEVALLRAEGCHSVYEDNLTLHATGLPQTTAIFVYGDSSRQTPFGGGTRCVGGAVVRTRGVRPVNGQVSWQVNYAHPNSSGRITPGSTWYFQAWYRDGANGVNTTDGLKITFTP